MVRGKYGRRSRSGDPEYVKTLLVRNLEHLSPGQFAKVMDTLGGDPAGQEITAAWIGKEKLRDVLNLRARITGSVPCERNVRDRLFAFYDWCAQNDDIPELLCLARTVSRWGRRDRRRGPDRNHERQIRKPEPDRQTRSPPRIRIPQPRQPAQARPHRLHPRHTMALTTRNQEENAIGNRTTT